jgi:hypothetical protein
MKHCSTRGTDLTHAIRTLSPQQRLVRVLTLHVKLTMPL